MVLMPNSEVFNHFARDLQLEEQCQAPVTCLNSSSTTLGFSNRGAAPDYIYVYDRVQVYFRV